MKKIQLTQGKFALVDDTDYEYLNQWKWNLQRGKHTWYAKRTQYMGGGSRHRVNNTFYMHRTIMGLKKKDGKIVDHKNGNGLDNQKHNLEVVNQAQNNFNRHYITPHSSKHTGVSWCKSRKKYVAYIQLDKKYIYLGRFDLEEEAYQARLKAERKIICCV